MDPNHRPMFYPQVLALAEGAHAQTSDEATRQFNHTRRHDTAHRDGRQPIHEAPLRIFDNRHASSRPQPASRYTPPQDSAYVHTDYKTRDEQERHHERRWEEHRREQWDREQARRDEWQRGWREDWWLEESRREQAWREDRWGNHRRQESRPQQKWPREEHRREEHNWRYNSRPLKVEQSDTRPVRYDDDREASTGRRPTPGIAIEARKRPAQAVGALDDARPTKQRRTRSPAAALPRPADLQARTNVSDRTSLLTQNGAAEAPTAEQPAAGDREGRADASSPSQELDNQPLDSNNSDDDVFFDAPEVEGGLTTP